MPRTRWIVLGIVAAAAVVSGAFEARGPFGAHEERGYATFLADVEAGRVDQIVQWRDRLEVTVGDTLVLVTVPADADLPGDLGRARVAGGVGVDLRRIPDPWLGVLTPVVPVAFLVAGAIIWAGSLLRARHATPDDEDASAGATSPRPTPSA